MQASQSTSAELSVERVGSLPVSGSSFRYIVIGSGPVGMRFVKELLQKEPNAEVLVLGNEPVQPYDRVLLSPLLAGQLNREDIDLSLPSEDEHPGFQFAVATVTDISTDSNSVVDSLGKVFRYEHLILATGARAHVPNIEGRNLEGVFRFRSLADAEKISARVARSVNTLVLGGGLLGLEAAKAMYKAGNRVTVVQQGPWLMNRQLDEKAADLLREEISDLGIRVVTQSGVREILGSTRVEAVRLHSGDLLSCDTVVVCAGISPNKELALNAGIKVGRGILIDDHLKTNADNVYAIGECSEHRGQTYGLVSPGYEQASILASRLANEPAVYNGSQAVARLKVLGKRVSSMGDVVDPASRPGLTQISYSKGQSYRKLALVRGRVIGALAYGEWSEANRIQSLYQNGFYVWPWQRLLFRLTGRLWLTEPAVEVTQWPEKAIVCNCRQVTKGQIDLELARGMDDLPKIQGACGASSVCGTCKPLVEQLIAANDGVDAIDAASTEPTVAWKTLLLTSVLALIVAVIMVFAEARTVADSVQTQGWYEQIWNDKFWKQVTGFTLLGLTVIGLLMSLRKRFQFEWMGNFAYWRALHTVLGVLCISLLVMHTGLHLGHNLNRWLMIDFLALVVMGSLAGALLASSHKFSPANAMRFKRWSTWAHVIVSWPLPALLGAHILSVYYF